MSSTHDAERSPGPSPSAPSPGKPPVQTGRAGFGARLRNYFLTGLIVAGPLAITVWLTWSLITYVDDLVRPFVPVTYRPETYLPHEVPWLGVGLPGKIPGTGLIIVFVTLTLLGFLTANLVGRTLVELGERVLDRLPLVRSVYKGLKQVFETLFSQSGSSFRTVGLVEFPAPGMWSLVFLSQRPSDDITARLPSREEYVSVFLPCTPNPTTGFFFYVARSAVIELDIPVEAAAKLIMSAGLIQPSNGDTAKKLAAFAEAAKMVRAADIETADGVRRR
ncbi:MAG: DUF502 domain-containing protein [Bradyrhizobiaceae bacterium]|nr:DUF502 domain-containing protein [Bradyrhizobiaceae bacterium]